jgi:hypothetical protein
MTVETLLKNIRALVADDADTAGQTWNDAKYVIFINAGARFIFDAYPDSRVAATGMTVASWTDADAGTPQAVLCVDDAYQAAIVEYVVSRYYTRDSGDSRDATRAAAAHKRFLELLMPIGG